MGEEDGIYAVVGGTAVEAITLQTGGSEFTEALTENYLKVKVCGRHEAKPLDGFEHRRSGWRNARRPARHERCKLVVRSVGCALSNSGVHRTEQTELTCNRFSGYYTRSS